MTAPKELAEKISPSDLASKISRFIPEYPSITSDTFQKDLASKKEFYQLKLTSQSDAYKEGKSFKVYETDKFVTHDILKHQEMAARFISPYSPYREMLVWDDPGTGKSLLVAHVVENFKKIMTGEIKKRALVIAPPSVLPNLYKEFALLYDEEINSQKNITTLTIEQRENKKKAMVNASYEMQKPEIFAKRLVRMSDSDIIKMYSNSLIIIDEVHYIPGMKPETTKSIDIYRVLHRFLHLLQPHGIRTLLLTATPIQDKTHEIAAIMNLILPMNMQLPTGAAFNKKYISTDNKLINQDELLTYFRGRVSHVRASLTDAKIIEVGEPLSDKPIVVDKSSKINGTSMIVDRSTMSKFQSDIVKKTSEDATLKIKKVKTKTKKEVLSAFHADERQASNFVFPDGSYGTEGFNNYCVKKSTIKTTKLLKSGKTVSTTKEHIKYALNPELIAALDKNGIAYYSAKFAKIIDDAIANPTHVRFIFCESILGSGAILLALLFQYKKFRWLENSYTPNDERKNPNARGNVVVIGTDPGAINSTAKITQLIKDMKSEDNVDGNRVQIVIGGRKIALGLSFMNVREIDIVMPPWDISILEQAMYRGLRFGSHKWLPKEERVVHIRKHVNVYEDDSLTSPDENIYLLAEKKDIQDAPVYRLLKRAALDCPLTYDRNVLKTDVDGSRVCNYTICNYSCVTFPPTSITKLSQGEGLKEIYNYNVKNPTTETYNLYYNKSDVKKLIHDIHDIFRKYFTLTFEQLKILTNTTDSYLLLDALDNMIGNSKLMFDMYGTVCILQEYKNIYYISSITANDHYSSLYNRFPLIWKIFSLDDVRRNYGYVCDSKIFKNCNAIKKDPSGLNGLSWDGAVTIYESLFIDNIKTPLKGLKKQMFDMLQTRFGKNAIFKIKKDDTTSYIHNLYSDEYTGISYGVKTQFVKPTGRLRIYTSSSDVSKGDRHKDVFISVPIDEEITYLDIMRRKSSKSKIDSEIYGSIQKKDGKFRIHDMRKGKATQGLVCDKGGTKLDYIAGILDEFKWYPSTIEESFKDMSEDDLKHRIKGNSHVPENKKTKAYLNSLNHEDLMGMLTIYSMSKPELCTLLRENFEKNNLIENL